MKKLTRAAVVAVVAVGAIALPTAAHASTIYPPSDACQITPATTTPGGTVQFSCDAGTFGANESVTITVTGESGADATIGMVRFAISTGSETVTSGTAGQLADTPITLPSNASGVYNIAALSATSAGGTASATVTADGSALPSTGGDSTLLTVWAGGGLLLLAGGAVAVAATVRRSKRTA